MYIDNTSNISGTTISTFMQTISSVTSNIKGFVKLSKKTDSTKFIVFQITEITDNTGWFTISITHQSSSDISPFADSKILLC